MTIVDCLKEGKEEFLQLGYDRVRNCYYAQVKSKHDLRIYYFQWLTNDYEESKRLAEEIQVY